MARKIFKADDAEAKYIESSSAGKWNQDDALFIAQELNYIRARALEVEHSPLNSFRVFPQETDVPAGAETALTIVYDSVGMAKIVADYGDDLPRAEAVATTIPSKVFTVADSYGYNYVELEHARLANVNLEARKALASRRGIDLKLNNLAWFGDADHGITGFINNANIPTVTIPADGTGSSALFVDKTPDQIIRDMNSIINEISTNTNGVEMPDTVLMSPAVYDLLESTPKSQYSDRTILEFLRGAHPEVSRWMKIGELAGAGTGGTDMVFAGVFRPEYIRQENPVRFEQLPVQYRNLEYVVPCVSRTLGVTINVPVCFASAYGM